MKPFLRDFDEYCYSGFWMLVLLALVFGSQERLVYARGTLLCSLVD